MWYFLPSAGLNMQQLHTTDTCCCPNQVLGSLPHIKNKMLCIVAVFALSSCFGSAEVPALHSLLLNLSYHKPVSHKSIYLLSLSYLSNQRLWYSVSQFELSQNTRDVFNWATDHCRVTPWYCLYSKTNSKAVPLLSVDHICASSKREETVKVDQLH